MLKHNLKQNIISVVKPFITLLILILIITISSLFLGELFEQLRNLVESWPTVLTALFGITDIFSKHGSLMVFYMALIIVNMVTIVIIVSSAINSFKIDDECSLTGFYLNQPYTRNQIFFTRLLVGMFTACLQWVLYIGMIYVAVNIICTQFEISFSLESTNILTMGVRGVIFLLFYFALSLSYFMGNGNKMHCSSFVTIIILCGFALGNVYKLLHLTDYYIHMAQGNIELVTKLGEILEYFRILFPFTLLNLLNEEVQPLPNYTYGVYGGIAVFLLCVSWLGYRRKELG